MPFGNLSSLRRWVRGWWSSTLYNNLNQLTQKTNGNGTSTTYAYDAKGDMSSEVNLVGTTVNSSLTYTYNVLGEPTSMTDAAGNVTQYAYDATGQLTQITLPGGTTITYGYNAAGNRTEEINGGTTTNFASNNVNEITQVGSAAYTYDANGNLQTVSDSGGTTTYSYNDSNQLVSITAPDGTITNFQFSPLGFLIGETVGGVQTSFLVDPSGIGNAVSSYNGAGTLLAHFNFGLGLVSQTSPAGAIGTGYYDFDGSGNTIGITGASGTYVNTYSYLPFGETTTVSAALPNPFTFGGQFGVIQIGPNLFNMRARVYMPTTGQFLSNDPLGLGGGDSNLRRFVFNSPTQLIDPTGTSPVAGDGSGGVAIGTGGLYVDANIPITRGDVGDFAGSLMTPSVPGRLGDIVNPLLPNPVSGLVPNPDDPFFPPVKFKIPFPTLPGQPKKPPSSPGNSRPPKPRPPKPKPPAHPKKTAEQAAQEQEAKGS